MSSNKISISNFSVQPLIPAGARPVEPGTFSSNGRNTGGSSLPADIAFFRRMYIMERNILQRCLWEDGKPDYVPGHGLDGLSKSLSVEDKDPKNAWVDSYQNLQILLPKSLCPVQYVRVLFWLLRSGSVAIPQPRQLSSVNYIKLVLEFWHKREVIVAMSLACQLKTVKTDLSVYMYGYGYSRLRAIYQMLVDGANGMTALFRYSLARNTIGSVSSTDLMVGDTKYIRLIDKLGGKYQILASLEYTLFPELYDRVWGEVLPPQVAEEAEQMLSDIAQHFG